MKGTVMTRSTHPTPWRRAFALVVAATAGVLLFTQGSAVAAPAPVIAPAMLGAPALPGPIVDSGKPSSSMTILKAAPDVAVPGTAFTLTGSGLPANRDVSIVWMTASVTYILDARPDSVDYIGEKSDKISTLIGKATTDATGKLTVPLKAPQDF